MTKDINKEKECKKIDTPHDAEAKRILLESLPDLRAVFGLTQNLND